MTIADSLLALDTALPASLRQHGYDALVDAFERAVEEPDDGDAVSVVKRLVAVLGADWRAPVVADAFVDGTPSVYFRFNRLTLDHLARGVRELLKRHIVPRLPYVVALAIAFTPPAEQHYGYVCACLLSVGGAVMDVFLPRVGSPQNLVETMAVYASAIAMAVPLETVWPPKDARIRAMIASEITPNYMNVRFTGFEIVKVHYDYQSQCRCKNTSLEHVAIHLAHGSSPTDAAPAYEETTLVRTPPFVVSSPVLTNLVLDKPLVALHFASVVLALERDGRARPPTSHVSWAAFEARDTALVIDLLRAGRFASTRERDAVERLGSYRTPWGPYDVERVLTATRDVPTATLAHFIVLLGRQALETASYVVGSLVPFVAALAPDARPAFVDAATAAEAMADGHDAFFVQHAPVAFVRAYARRLVVTPPTAEITRDAVRRLSAARVEYDARECAEDVVVAALLRKPLGDVERFRADVEAAVCARPVLARALVAYGESEALATMLESAAVRNESYVAAATADLVKRRRVR